jgi:hypothetical protein
MCSYDVGDVIHTEGMLTELSPYFGTVTSIVTTQPFLLLYTQHNLIFPFKAITVSSFHFISSVCYARQGSQSNL